MEGRPGVAAGAGAAEGGKSEVVPNSPAVARAPCRPVPLLSPCYLQTMSFPCAAPLPCLALAHPPHRRGHPMPHAATFPLPHFKISVNLPPRFTHLSSQLSYELDNNSDLANAERL